MIEAIFANNAEKRGDLLRSKYARSDLPAEQDSRSTYFPDAMIDSFVQEAHNTVPRTIDAHIARPEEFDLLKGAAIAEPQISVEEAKAVIIDALTEFDPELGQRASELLNDSDRLNLHEVPIGTGGMMRVRPAGLVMDQDDPMRLENSGLPQEFIDDLRSRYPSDENIDGKKAVIDFDYNGSIGSVIYLAHELGHALADDLQLAAGYSYRDNPVHMQETQAYLVQNIVLDRLRAHENPEIAIAANRSYTADMTRNLYDLSLSMAAKDALDAVSENRNINPAQIFEERFGKSWEEFIQEDKAALNVFETISSLSISTEEQRSGIVQTLQDEFARIHFRPMAIMTGSALASHLWDQDLQTRRVLTENVFGGNGPKKIDDVLQVAGIDQNGISKLAQQTVAQSVAYLAGYASSMHAVQQKIGIREERVSGGWALEN